MTWLEKSTAFLIVSAVFAVSAGCGGSDSGGSGNGGSSGSGGAGQCDVFRPGFSKTGANGISTTLVDASPATPVADDNSWTISVKDRNGTPVDGATIAVSRAMPLHGGHSTAREPIITPLGGGNYKLDPMNFTMEGVWQIGITVTTPATTDSVQFNVCVT